MVALSWYTTTTRYYYKLVYNYYKILLQVGIQLLQDIIICTAVFIFKPINSQI